MRSETDLSELVEEEEGNDGCGGETGAEGDVWEEVGRRRRRRKVRRERSTTHHTLCGRREQ